MEILIPSGVIKDGWKMPELNEGLNRKITDLNGPFSSKPCLMTPEDNDYDRNLMEAIASKVRELVFP